MKKIISLAIVAVFSLLLVGCSSGIPQEDYNAVVHEREAAISELDSVKTINATLEAQASELSDKLEIETSEKEHAQQQTLTLETEKQALQADFDKYIADNEAFAALTEAQKQGEMDVAARTDEIKELESTKAALTTDIETLTNQKVTLESEVDALKNQKHEYEAAPVQLKNGNFTAGIDFDPGVYDVVAVAGRGTVTTDNYDAFFNQMMAAKANSYYISEFSNVSLPEGTVITVSGVTIELRVRVK